MKYTDFLTEFSKEPDSEDNIYVLVSGKGQRQHVYDFEKDGLQVWVWRNRIRTVLNNCNEQYPYMDLIPIKERGSNGKKNNTIKG